MQLPSSLQVETHVPLRSLPTNAKRARHCTGRPSPLAMLVVMLMLSSLLPLNRLFVCSHAVSSRRGDLTCPKTDGRAESLSRRDFAQALGRQIAAASLASAVVAGHPTSSEAAPSLLSNPFATFETVDQVPKEYFENRRSIYAFVERVVDGDTLRVRHIPYYRSWWGFLAPEPQPLQTRKLSDQTLLVRLYGVDAPEIAKGGSPPPGQPFSQQAKQFTSNLAYHKVVRVKFLRKDQYQRAVCQVETVPQSSSAGLLSFLSWVPGLGPKDLSVELAAAGLAELYIGGGAEYNNKREVLEKWIDRAKLSRKGQWSLEVDERVSAAEYKRQQRAAKAARRFDDREPATT